MTKFPPKYSHWDKYFCPGGGGGSSDCCTNDDEEEDRLPDNNGGDREEGTKNWYGLNCRHFFEGEEELGLTCTLYVLSRTVARDKTFDHGWMHLSSLKWIKAHSLRKRE